MSDNSFESIAHGILKQKQIMEQLQKENEHLRRQLADLREGYGIFIEIDGKRFALTLPGEQDVTPAIMSAAPVEATLTQQEGAIQPFKTRPTQPLDVLFPDDASPEVSETLTPLTETTSPRLAVIEGKQEELVEQKEQKIATPTFLEEVMINEFAAAATSPMSIWTGPAKQSYEIDEEEKAALRQQLIGSFLLE